MVNNKNTTKTTMRKSLWSAEEKKNIEAALENLSDHWSTVLKSM